MINTISEIAHAKHKKTRKPQNDDEYNCARKAQDINMKENKTMMHTIARTKHKTV